MDDIFHDMNRKINKKLHCPVNDDICNGVKLKSSTNVAHRTSISVTSKLYDNISLPVTIKLMQEFPC